MYNSIDINDINKININGNLIDIRDRNSYLLGHISGALNILYMDLIMNPNLYLRKDKRYYIYCFSGKTSRKIVLNLNKEGYNLVDLVGGYNKYIKNI